MRVVIYTHNHSMHVKTLHMIMNLINTRPDASLNITFHENESPSSPPKDDLTLHIKWGMNMQPSDVFKMIDNEWPEGKKAVVVPSPLQHIDWNTFKQKALDEENITEPIEQWGLHFNVELGDKIDDNYWSLKELKAKPRIWMTRADCIIDDLQMHEIAVLPDANVTTTMVHESVANIAHSAGIQMR